jgi:hypothetical protein
MAFLRWLQAIYIRYAPWAGAWLPRIGVALLLIAAAFAARSWLFARSLQRSIATVTENVSTFAPQGGVIYLPRLRFRTPAGETVQVTASSGIDEVEFAAGETVPVLYPAANPRAAIIATVWRAYHAAIVFALWGVLLFDVGFVLRRLSSATPPAPRQTRPT